MGKMIITVILLRILITVISRGVFTKACLLYFAANHVIVFCHLSSVILYYKACCHLNTLAQNLVSRFVIIFVFQIITIGYPSLLICEFCKHLTNIKMQK